MGLHPEQLDEHARVILGSRRILHRQVVLCEGERSAPADRQRRPSPQTYRRQETLPDSNFYRRCVPPHWRDRPPQFFNCGDRLDVLQTYARLRQLHAEDSAASYLDPEKLYAIVDLDLQPAALEHSPCATTEELHEALYAQTMLRQPLAGEHRIWVTALIHKEAFFVLPSVACVYDELHDPPYLDGRRLDLIELCRDAARAIDPSTPAPDHGLVKHFEIARRRLSRWAPPVSLDMDEPEALSRSWLAALGDGDPSTSRTEALARVLFLVTKAKPHWKRIEPPSGGDYTSTADHFRGQLALAVAGHIASLPPEAHPIAGFFEHLHAQR